MCSCTAHCCADAPFSALAGARFLGHGRTGGALYDLGDYPVLAEGAGFVYGELYAVDRNALEALDRIEGHCPDDPGRPWYERRPLSVCSFADGSTVTAWGYVYRRDLGGARPILGGDYRRDRADRAGPLQWYLAYGSNLHSVRLLKRFGHEHVAFVETGFLTGTSCASTSGPGTARARTSRFRGRTTAVLSPPIACPWRICGGSIITRASRITTSAWGCPSTGPTAAWRWATRIWPPRSG
ncbi:MAG: gamma-glutamylcyclotransferase [Candidatus Competibacteraceae bacterium]|nr:gamma-glutamylcyclotransferase [Candidatus Competibacteraceae bacterium]